MASRTSFRVSPIESDTEEGGAHGQGGDAGSSPAISPARLQQLAASAADRLAQHSRVGSSSLAEKAGQQQREQALLLAAAQQHLQHMQEAGDETTVHSEHRKVGACDCDARISVACLPKIAREMHTSDFFTRPYCYRMLPVCRCWSAWPPAQRSSGSSM
jgi:hypothetical protein